jgi:hypothetical protein
MANGGVRSINATKVANRVQLRMLIFALKDRASSGYQIKVMLSRLHYPSARRVQMT